MIGQYPYQYHIFQFGALRETCEQFKLEEEKGVYPYDFASKETLNYIGDVPAPKYWNEGDYEKYEGDKIISNTMNADLYGISLEESVAIAILQFVKWYNKNITTEKLVLI